MNQPLFDHDFLSLSLSNAQQPRLVAMASGTTRRQKGDQLAPGSGTIDGWGPSVGASMLLGVN